MGEIKGLETDRIKEAYDRRKKVVPKGLYSYFNKGNLFIAQGREKAILNLLDKYGMNPLDDKVILDLGCGGGRYLGILSNMEQAQKIFTVLIYCRTGLSIILPKNWTPIFGG